MKFPTNIPALVLLAASFVASHAQEAQRSAPREIDVLEMREIPAGHYLVSLQLDGKDQRINIEVKDGAGECVNSTDPGLKGMQGKFESIGNGVFLVFFVNDNHRASQFWLFRKDGSASVKEVPDRGEKQIATPVPNESIEPARKP